MVPYPSDFPTAALTMLLDKVRGKDIPLSDLAHGAWNVQGYAQKQLFPGGPTVYGEALPSGWEEKAKQLGALKRIRNFTPEKLLRVLFIHLARGSSLRVTAAQARMGNLVSVSDVALLKRLDASGDWMNWMAEGVMRKWFPKPPAAVLEIGKRIRLIDGTTVQEPGSTGTTWKIHYSTELPSLRCSEVHVTDPSIGESFSDFEVCPGDFFLGDRGYCQRSGMAHVIHGQGDVLVRIKHHFPLLEENGTEFDLFGRLRALEINRVGDWKTSFEYKGEIIGGRVCAVKKSVEATEKVRKAILKEANKKGRKVRPKTLEAAGYIFVFTTAKEEISARQILELYRGRWQVELAFKRLKSILGVGHLRKTNPEGAKAWLHGKTLVAFLIEAMIRAGDFFSPWGYDLAREN